MKWTRRKRRGKSTIRVYDGSKLAHSLEPPVIKNNNRLTYLRNLHYPDTEPVADATRNKKKVDVALRSTKKKSVQHTGVPQLDECTYSFEWRKNGR
ncbi:uncharacterized protein [Triticum aestivum]|uniref:uncharacterized protein isoform X2 n=1 Tax=Triticum aestivum TaxID=4565 RepID=UPI001D0350E3|nr:uncharacterized protein LOC123097265 isoform X2 [Triticum aestivum]